MSKVQNTLPVSWRDKAMQSIQTGLQQSVVGSTEDSNAVSFRNGRMTYHNEDRGNDAKVYILAHRFQRSYYSKPYDPDTRELPDCFSMNGIAPHENSKTPQADACAECHFNRFNTAPGGGKGKACREKHVLAWIFADAGTPEEIEKAAIARATLSVMNRKIFKAHHETVELGGEAMWQRITNVHVEPHSKTQYRASYGRDTRTVLGDAMLNALASRVSEAEEMLDTPYEKEEEKEGERKRKF
jgi:hypothetical protein